MWDNLVQGSWWLLLIFFGLQGAILFGAIGWIVWIDAIKPRLIPPREIERVADEIITNYPDPEEEAFARHQRAWFRSDGAEQVYWLRVRKAVRRRLGGAGVLGNSTRP